MSEHHAESFESAVYIKAQEKPSEFTLYDPIPLFRKEFDVTLEIKSAEILVQSPGFACYYINGKSITEDIFISPLSNYSKCLWYNTYDVTALLRKGKNTIGVMAGNGFLNESFNTAWDYQNSPWRDAPQFLLCLKINGETVETNTARVSKIPFNRRWPGHQRSKDQTELISFVSCETDETLMF